MENDLIAETKTQVKLSIQKSLGKVYILICECGLA